MQFRDLNDDVISEILRQFVAMDDEGPLTLIMVCSLWRDLVMSNPRFWTWIAIDDNIGDLDDRIQIFRALSADCPLQLTIRLPVQEVDRFQPIFERCNALFIDKCGQNDSSEIEKDVQGICNILKSPSTGSITRIHWYNEDEPSLFSPHSLQDQLFKVGKLDLEPVFNVFPATMISALELKPRTNLLQADTAPEVSYSNLCNALSNLPHLTTLHISTDRLGGILEEGMTHIRLPLLHILSLTIPLPSSDPNWSILQYIIAPSVRSVCLGGALRRRHIFAGASELGKNMRPKKLTLEIIGKTDFSGYGMRALDYNLTSVEYLTVSLQAPGENWDAPSRWWEDLHSILASMHHLALFDLRFRGDLACFQDLIGPVSCDLHVYCRGPFHGEARPSMQLWMRNISSYITDKIAKVVGPLVQPGRRVERMTVLVGRHRLQGVFTQLNIPVSSLKALIIRVDEVAGSGFDRTLPATRLAWLESLQELDIRGVEFHNLYDFSDTGGSLPNLVILKCPIRVAIQLIKYVHTPQLRKLTIVESDPVTSGMDQWNFEHLIILATTYEIDKRPPLRCIALEFYPRWKTFLEMVTAYSRPRENQPETILRSVELPALPHPSILRLLVSALRGEQVAAKDIPPISANARRDDCCYFCRRSGWKCVYLTDDHCDRHSPHNLVTVTVDTLGGLRVGGQARAGEGNV